MGRGAEETTANPRDTKGLLRKRVRVEQEEGDKRDIILRGDLNTERDAARPKVTLNKKIESADQPGRDKAIIDSLGLALDSEEDFLKRTRASLMVEYPSQETVDDILKDRLKDFRKEQKKKSEKIKNLKEYLALYKDEASLLVAEGVNDFSSFDTGEKRWNEPVFQTSPAVRALSNFSLYRKDYSIRIREIDDPLLIEEGKNFAFSISNVKLKRGTFKVPDKKEDVVITKGFAATEDEAKEKAEALIQESMDKAWENLREEYSDFIKAKSIAEEKNQKEKENVREEEEREFEHNNKILKEREKKKRVLEGLDHENYGVSMHGSEWSGNVFLFEYEVDKSRHFPFLLHQDISDIRRESFAGFELVSFHSPHGQGAAVFKEGKLYAATPVPTKNHSGYGKLFLFGEGYVEDSYIGVLGPTQEEADEFRNELHSRVKKRIKKELGAEHRDSKISSIMTRLSSKRREKHYDLEEKRKRLRSKIEAEEALLLRKERRGLFLENIKDLLREDARKKALTDLE